MSTAGQSHKSGLDSWEKCSSPNSWRRDGSTCFLKQCGEAVGVVLVGGISGDEETSSSVELLEWRLGKWWTLPPLLEARAGCATACVRGTIFVVGGYQISTGSALESGERFEFGTTHQWKPLDDAMETPRWYCAAVALARPEVVMVVGGRNQQWKELNTVEAYDVSLQTWKSLPSMKTPRLAPAAVAIGLSRIMVMGGYDGKNRVNTVEAYDYHDGEWTELPPMPVPCAFASAVSVVQEGRFVLVFGGDEDSTKQVVQLYSVRERAWRLLETSCPPMNQGCLVTAIDQNLLLLSQDRPENSHGNVTMTCSLTGISINELWEESTVSHTSVEESQEQERQRQTQQPQQQLENMSSYLTESERRLPLATSVVAIPLGPSATAEMNQGTSHLDRLPSGSSLQEQQDYGQDDTTRTVENKVMVDSKGRDVWYTGEISIRTERPHGKGRMVWEFEGDTYDGEFRDGLRHGYGQFTYANGDSFEGFFERDKKCGFGSYGECARAFNLWY